MNSDKGSTHLAARHVTKSVGRSGAEDTVAAPTSEIHTAIIRLRKHERKVFDLEVVVVSDEHAGKIVNRNGSICMSI